MAASVSTTAAAGQHVPTGIRPVNLRRDLGAMADLIELCFAPTMDDAGRAAVREMRSISQSGPLLVFLSGLNQILGGLEEGFVWYEGGRLIGNVSVSGAGFPPSLGRTYSIANVAVHPDFRRRGIAKALMQASLAFIRARRGVRAILNVEAANTGARELYRGLGFVEERTFIRWRRQSHLRPPAKPDNMPYATLRGVAEWREEYALALRVRPNERGGLGWQMPVHEGEFRPRLLRATVKALSGQVDERWVVRKPGGEGIAGSLRVTRSLTGASRLILLTDPAFSGQVEEPLLNYVLRRLNDDVRPAALEHPADDEASNEVLERYGFERRHTLVSMRANLE